MKLPIEIINAPIAISLADPTQPDTPLIFVNRSFETLTGYQNAEIIGKNCRFLNKSQLEPEQRAELRDAIKTKASIEICLRNFRATGEAFDNLLIMRTIRTRSGRSLIFGSQFEISNQIMEMTVRTHLRAVDSAMDEIDGVYLKAARANMKSLDVRSEILISQISNHLS